MSTKRHSQEEAETIMARLREYSFEDLHPLFEEGGIPLFEEIEGDTAASLLAWNPRSPWWRKLLTRIAFDNPFARWTGKRFTTPFGEERAGRGINLFQNRILPRRHQFDTCIEKALLDQGPCLVLDYGSLPSPLAGTRDELRRIEDGAFVGRGYHKLPWEKEPLFVGYFVLCALERAA